MKSVTGHPLFASNMATGSLPAIKSLPVGSLPTSKSITQRALLIGALGRSRSQLRGALVCDDSRHLTALLGAVGADVQWDGHDVSVEPATLRAPSAPVNCGNAGTAVRFGSCLALLLDGPLTIDGNSHMRKRPIGPLGDALESLGVDVAYLGAPRCPPHRLRVGPKTANEVTIDASLSSQYVSGLMMVAPRLAGGLQITLVGERVSQPYINMTESMMKQAGAQVDRIGDDVIVVAPKPYHALGSFEVESDWSAAAFLLVAERILNRPIELELTSPEQSLQGDAAIVEMLNRLDREEINRFDLTHCPDLIAPLTAAAVFAARPTEIVGAAHTRVKECDRVLVLATELAKLGANISARPDGLSITPSPLSASSEVVLDPSDDHRMAMTFALVSLRVPNLRVSSPECVAKSFPNFWSVQKILKGAAREQRG